jgi:hypothetical protein
MSTYPKGFTCKCGEFHLYPLCVYAHWREVLDFTCPKCNAQYSVMFGNAKLKRLTKAQVKS